MVRQCQMIDAGKEETGRKSNLEEDARKATDTSNLNYMNYETFKKALVRIAVIAAEHLGG